MKLGEVRGAARCLALAAALCAVGCGDGDGDGDAPAFVGASDGLPANCNPLRAAGVCGLPFPSSIYSEPDETTETGQRVALPSEILPPSAATEDPFDPTLWNEGDGFSSATPVLAYFEEKLDPASLPSQDDFTQSLSPTSATLLLDLESGTLLPHFSELDLSADIEPTERQPLMLRPAAHLRPGGHYAVAVTSTLRTLDGSVPQSPPGFQSALRGAKAPPGNAMVAKALAGARVAIDAFAKAGVEKKSLLLAWDFHTASLNQSTKHVLAMRDRALAQVGDAGMGYTIDSVEDAPNAEIYKRVRGTFKVPSFLTSDDRSLAEAELVFGGDGLPEIQRVADYPFELVIPKSAETAGAYPLLVYGHGLLGAANQVSSGHVRSFCNDKGWLCIGTDWIGLSEQEEGGIGQNGAAWKAVQDINRFPWVGHRLAQSLVNFMALSRVAKSIAKDPAVALPGGQSPLADPFQVAYYGISQGGIMGTSLLAYSPDIEHAVVQVGGSAYSLMIQRSVNWNQFFPAIRNAYPDRVHQQLLMALWQPMFDISEGSGTAYAQGEHPPLAGTKAKHALIQIAVGDSQVSNLAAEIQARTMGIPLLTPSPKSVWGLTETSGGVDNALALWDLVREPPPATNATPTTDNDVHADIRKLPENQQQTDTFLRTGKAEHTCTGPCSFPGVNP